MCFSLDTCTWQPPSLVWHLPHNLQCWDFLVATHRCSRHSHQDLRLAHQVIIGIVISPLLSFINMVNSFCRILITNHKLWNKNRRSRQLSSSDCQLTQTQTRQQFKISPSSKICIYPNHEMFFVVVSVKISGTSPCGVLLIRFFSRCHQSHHQLHITIGMVLLLMKEIKCSITQ